MSFVITNKAFTETGYCRCYVQVSCENWFSIYTEDGLISLLYFTSNRATNDEGKNNSILVSDAAKT